MARSIPNITHKIAPLSPNNTRQRTNDVRRRRAPTLVGVSRLCTHVFYWRRRQEIAKNRIQAESRQGDTCMRASAPTRQSTYRTRNLFRSNGAAEIHLVPSEHSLPGVRHFEKRTWMVYVSSGDVSVMMTFSTLLRESAPLFPLG